MKAVVTGAAGFIGSHTAERFLSEGWAVLGVDSLTDYYPVSQKQANLDRLQDFGGFSFLAEDLRSAELEPMLLDADVVLHLAAQPGVRASWDDFDVYVQNNVSATNRVLLAAARVGVNRLVYASSSSVYGAASRYPTSERDVPAPMSPYGVTKLAGEHLCGVFAQNFGLATVSLRYFTVFGPRQRPDMGMHRLIEAALTGASFPLYGSGDQIRDFTYVGDVVQANFLAATRDIAPGSVLNVAGGSAVSLRDVIRSIETLAGRDIVLDGRGVQPGDVPRTGGTTDQARLLLEWIPQISLHEGLARQLEWHELRHQPA